MGEYAIRKKDRAEIKIGTCEDMYYIRYEDRDKVDPLPGNVNIAANPDGCRFRLPFPDEDHLSPGEYDDYNRGLRLYRKNEHGHDDFPLSNEAVMSQVGNIQLRHEASGLLLNVACFHGTKLPEVGPRMRAFWNGKGYSLVLSSLRIVKDNNVFKVYPVVRCRHCDAAWRVDWADVLEYIEPAMRERLAVYAT